MNRPILGITMGDPAGCGPEITVRALSDAAVYQRCRPLVIGDIKCIRDALRVTNHSELKLHQVDRPSQGLYEFGTIDVLHLELVDWDRFSYNWITSSLLILQIFEHEVGSFEVFHQNHSKDKHHTLGNDAGVPVDALASQDGQSSEGERIKGQHTEDASVLPFIFITKT